MYVTGTLNLCIKPDLELHQASERTPLVKLLMIFPVKPMCVTHITMKTLQLLLPWWVRRGFQPVTSGQQSIINTQNSSQRMHSVAFIVFIQVLLLRLNCEHQ